METEKAKEQIVSAYRLAEKISANFIWTFYFPLPETLEVEITPIEEHRRTEAPCEACRLRYAEEN